MKKHPVNPDDDQGAHMPGEPTERDEESHAFDEQVAGYLGALAAGDDSARASIVELFDARLRELTHRLLGKFAKVRRWDSTDDVAQNAAMRLYRALGQTVPDSPKGLMGLMAVQIQRELIDLARKHSGPMSYAANHGTNVVSGSDGEHYVDALADDPDSEDAIPIERWEAFHAAVDALPEDLREIFRLVWYLGLDQQAAAETLGMSLRTVERRWLEAREMVTRKLK